MFSALLSEICSIVKPGGIGISASALMLASDVALAQARGLHSVLVGALQQLEARRGEQQATRLHLLRRLREAQTLHAAATAGPGQLPQEGSADGGLNLNDPILRYDFTHVTSGCTVAK